MNFTLNQLRIFSKVAELGSITKAAQELHLTQPAVSIQLKNLQEQFALPIIEIVGRKVHVTDFGMELAKGAEAILEQVYAINYQSLSYQGQLTGKLKIMSVSTGKYVMPYFLEGFMKAHPGIELNYQVTNKSQVQTALEKNEIDFGLVSMLPEDLQLVSQPLLSNKLCLVGHPDLIHQGEELPWKEVLASHPFLFREPGSGTRIQTERWLKLHHIVLPKRMELSTNEAVKQAVKAGLGISIMPIIGIIDELKRKEIKIIEAPGLPMLSEWQLVHLKGKKLMPASLALIQYLQKNTDGIKAKWFGDA
ncbi:MAG: LysR family transcriptional regulator [Bacteroidota bacterium]|nr:LysR family transcriptional regulator [Bacteroidota bacterium]MDX5431453.1 LysR family transcriptional regulator [Bacteroidota bacterium]MDX5470181.1 LysR family transcriptional regulator [Bacteroidota bacterium]